MRATPQSDTVSPVSISDFEAWLGVDDNGTFFDWLVVATDQAIGYLNRDLLTRSWQLVINREKQELQVAYNRYPDRSFGTVELPFTQLVSVDSVKIDGEDADHEVDSLSQPARVHVGNFGEQLEIIYTAGSSTVPPSIKTAIKLIAQYLYEHAGQCDAPEALTNSGAVALLRPYRVEWL